MTKFPQYRKLEGFDRYYKIIDDRHFLEASKKQGRWNYQEVEAAQYPEMVRIMDMLNESWNFVKMSQEEIAAIFPES